MTVTPINPLVLAYTQPDGESRNSAMDLRTGTPVASRRAADAQDSLDLSPQGLELSRTAARGGPLAPALPRGLLQEAPVARAGPRSSRSMDLLT